MSRIGPIILGASIFLLFKYGPEFFQYSTYRIYKEIKALNERIEKLEKKHA